MIWRSDSSELSAKPGSLQPNETVSGKPGVIQLRCPIETGYPAGEWSLKPADSPHINVSVEQLAYWPIALSRLRRLAQAILAGERPQGATTLERV